MRAGLNQAESLVREYLEARFWGGHYALSTVRLYGQCLDEFLRFLETEEKLTDLSRVDRKAISHYQESLSAKSNGYGTRTLGVRLLAVHDLFGWLERRGILSRNPASPIEFPTRREPAAGFHLTSEDLQKIIDAVERDTQRGLRDRAILELLSRNVMRAVEIAKLTLDDFKREEGEISIRSERERDRRRVALAGETRNAMNRYLEEGRGRFPNAGRLPSLFLRFEGRPMKHWHIALVVQRYRKRAGIRHYVSFHMIRMAAANALSQKEGRR